MKNIPKRRKFNVLRAGLMTALLLVITLGAFAVPVTINLYQHDGATLIGGGAGTAAWYNGSGGWNSLGALSTGTTTVDLPEGGYLFSMNFNNFTQQSAWVTVTSGGPNVINFTTTLVTIDLYNHNGNGSTSNLLAGGTAAYYTGSGGWNSIATTTGTSLTSNPQVELLPGTYQFNMNFNSANQNNWTVVNAGGGQQNVDFTTTLVTIDLYNHNGSGSTSNLLAGGTPTYYTGSGGWNSTAITTTGTSLASNPQVELLPGTYQFNMNLNSANQNYWTTISPGGGNQYVDFTTTLVTIDLYNHSGNGSTSNLLAGGTPFYYTGSGGWNPTAITTTGTSLASNPQVELLPGTYQFDMNFNSANQNYWTTVNAGGGNQYVDFTTTLVTIDLYNHNGNGGISGSAGNLLAGGTPSYYTGSGGWNPTAITTTGTSIASNPQVELLPGTYQFNMNFNSANQNYWTTVNAGGGDQYVDFTTTLVSENLKNCAGDLINTSAATAQFYTGSGGWNNFNPIAGGTTSAELLPGTYQFNMTYNSMNESSWSVVGTGPTQNVDFNTTKVTFSDPNSSTISYYTGSGGWNTFSTLPSLTLPSMEMLPGNYLFQTTSGGPSSWIAISGCSQTFHIAPCGTLAITATNNGGCGGSYTLTAPVGSSSYLWSTTQTCQSIVVNNSGTYSVNVNYDFACSGAADGAHTLSLPVTVTPNTVTVRLIDSKGNPITGATVQYYSGSWLSMGTTDANGYACHSFSSPTTTYFQVLYCGGTKEWSGISSAGDPILVAQTTDVSLNLKNHNGNLITTESGTPGYYNGSWVTLASTGTNGYVTKELLPGSYYFNMTFHYFTEQQTVTVGSGPNQNVDFQTTLVTTNLLNHTGSTGIAGGIAQYYSGGWHPIAGSTVVTGTNPQIELLPGAYYFNMNYNNFTQQSPSTTINSGGTWTQPVNFQTTLVTLNLLDHTGAYLAGGTAQYYSGGWYPLTGSTTTATATNPQIELLGGSYYFNMNYNNFTAQSAATTINGGGTWAQCVNFRTTLVTTTLSDHTNTLITAVSPNAGVAKYYSGTWYNVGATGSTSGTGSASTELLPGSYYFNMCYNHYTQQSPSTVVSDNGGTYQQTVPFRTTLVTTSLKDHTGAGLAGGAPGFYSGSWYPVPGGLTDGTGTNLAVELLAGSYYFNMNFNHYTQQSASTAINSGGTWTQCVPFQTTGVSLNLLDCSGGSPVLINTSAATANFYSGGWYPTPLPIAGGTTAIELLAGSYYFNMTYNNGTEQLGALSVSGTTYPVNFNTTKVTFSNPNSSAISYYQSGWNTFTSGMNLLPGNYYFKVTSGGATVSETIAGCSQNFIIAPCGAAITSVSNGGCGGSYTLTAPSGYKSYLWSPGGATTQSIVVNTSGTYSMTGAYDFSCSGAGSGTVVLTTPVTVTPSTVTIRLINSKGNPIAGGSPQVYLSGVWRQFGYPGTPVSTDANGYACLSGLSAGYYYFRVQYAGGTEQFPGTYSIATNPVLVAQTSDVQASLNTHSGSPLVGTAQYYSFDNSTWYPMGSTDPGTGLTAGTELLPDNYDFNMTYNNATYQLPTSISVSGTSTIVPFVTTTVTSSLNDHLGNGIAGGAARYYVYTASTWYSMGSTSAITGSTSPIELLPIPGGYTFDMTYNNQDYQLPAPAAVTGSTTNEAFVTATVTSSLKSSTGSSLVGAARYYSYRTSTWYSMGNTDGGTGLTAPIELLPVPGGYTFDMTYNNQDYQLPSPLAVAGSTTNEPFVTTAVTSSLKSSTATALVGAARYYSYHTSTWYSMGNTDGGTGYTAPIELLPVAGGYAFDMTYNNVTYQRPTSIAVTGTSVNEDFTTTAVTASLTSSASVPLAGGVAQYYSYNTGQWYPMGTTDGVTGTPSIELLPKPGGYAFNMTYNNGTYQLPSPLAVTGTSVTEAFNTSLITIHFQGSGGAAHTGAPISYYNNGWYPTFANTDGSGNASIEMLPAQYYYRGYYESAYTQVGPFNDNSSTTHNITTSAARYEAPGSASVSGTTEFGVYPNPATDKITIKFSSTTDKQASVKLTDISGKVIINEVIESAKGTNTYDVNLGNLPSGIYLLMFDNGDNSETRKINVQH